MLLHDAPARTSDQLNCSLNSLTLELTRKCNLSCVHCYTSSHPYIPLYGSMTHSQWLGVLSEGHTLGCRSVQFIGGEPTLFPQLDALIRRAKSIGYEQIELYTNGTLLRESLFELLTEVNGRIAFSIYSDKKEMHDQITRKSGSFEKTVRAIKRSLASGIPIRVGIISMSENSDSIASTISMLKRLGIEDAGVDRIRGFGRGKTSIQSENLFDELCGRCSRGKLCVNCDGMVYPCVFSEFYPLGNVSDGLEVILQSSKLKVFQEHVESRFGNLGCGPGSGCTPDAGCNPDSGCKPDADPPGCRPDVQCGPDFGCRPDATPCRP